MPRRRPANHKPFRRSPKWARRHWFFIAWTLLGTAWWAGPSLAQVDAGDEDKRSDQPEDPTPNPWVDAPEVARENEGTRTSAPPRRPGANEEVPNTPPVIPDEVLPVNDVVTPVPASVRLETVLDRATLGQYGALTLDQALSQVVGLHRIRTAPQTTLLGTRALGETSVDVRIDGAPALLPSILPGKSALWDVALLDVARARVLHGPQLTLGAARSTGAVLDLDTIDAPRELGDSLPLRGDLVAGMGGPEALKTLQLRAEGGVGRIRGTVSGSVLDTDNIHLGRGVGLLPASSAQGGTLGARVDVTISRRFRTFATWQSARQTRLANPNACFTNANGAASDCSRLFDVGRDALIVGLDAGAPWTLLGARVTTSARAHAQRVVFDQDRFGTSLTFLERREDEALRAGALGNVRFTWPSLGPLASVVRGQPSVELGGEVRRDRIFSQAFVRSTRGADANVIGPGIETPSQRSLVDGTSVGLETAMMTFRFAGPTVNAHAKASIGRAPVAIPPAPDLRIEAPRFVEALTGGADVGARVRLSDAWETFAAFQAMQTGPQVSALLQGPAIGEGPRLNPSTGETATTLASGELGARLSLAWLTLDVVTYGFQASGELRYTEGDAGAQLARGPTRFGTGLEIRGQWRTAIDGLTARGTLAAPLLDEGELFDEQGALQLPFVAMTPADRVTGPYGDLALAYAPSASWFSAFVRTRFVAPHARLGPTERNEPQFCNADEVPQVGSVLPCLGAPGHIGLDVGGRFAPGDAFAIDAVAENLLDLPFAPRTSPLPWGGLGVRLKLTVRL